MLADQSKERVMPVSQQSAEKAIVEVDPSWKGLYRIGGISAMLCCIRFENTTQTIVFWI